MRKGGDGGASYSSHELRSQDLSDIPEWAKDFTDVPVMPLYLQRRWARITRQYIETYWKGADAVEAKKLVLAMRTEGRHRDTSDPRMIKVEAEMAAAANHM